MGKKEARERQNKAKEGFILLSLLSQGKVQLGDWTNLAETNAVDWNDVHQNVSDLEQTLLIINQDPFVNYFYSWLSKGDGKGHRTLQGIMAQRAAQYFLAKSVQHYIRNDRPTLTGGGVIVNRRNAFIKAVRKELDGTIYDYVTGVWGGGGADESLKTYLADPASTRKRTHGDNDWQKLIKNMMKFDGELAGLTYYKPEGNGAEEESDWDVDSYDTRIRVILTYHHALCGFRADKEFPEELKGWDVEHIIPKAIWKASFKGSNEATRLAENRCHHLANFTLLGASTNRSKSDLPPSKIPAHGGTHQLAGLKQMEKLLNMSETDLLTVDGCDKLKTVLIPKRKDYIIKSFSDDHRKTILDSNFVTYDPAEEQIAKLVL